MPSAFKIVISPIHGLYERPTISVALFVNDHLQLAAMGSVRSAWLLALGRMTVVAFFAVFVVLLTRPSIRKAQTRLGWNPSTDLRTAVRKTLDCYFPPNREPRGQGASETPARMARAEG